MFELGFSKHYFLNVFNGFDELLVCLPWLTMLTDDLILSMPKLFAAENVKNTR